MLTLEECERVIHSLRSQFGDSGAPIHQRHGWGGFLDVIEKRDQERRSSTQGQKTTKQNRPGTNCRQKFE
jgi:hypothetical protein